MNRVYSVEELEAIILEAQQFVATEIRLANTRGDLEAYLRRIGLEIQEAYDEEREQTGPRVLVIGGSQVSQSDILHVIQTHSPWDEECFDFILDYKEVGRFDFSTLRNTRRYTHVMVGPMGHKQRGIPSESSAIREMEANPDLYPRVIRLLSANNTLMISRNSFLKGLLELL